VRLTNVFTVRVTRLIIISCTSFFEVRGKVPNRRFFKRIMTLTTHRVLGGSYLACFTDILVQTSISIFPR